ncbi:methyltransferase domain-containing protein [Oculatella sp. LEGE 06141]|uniref:class I SAM-dependent methyltransferase n=1 Tax=Oculatella sp. LEGE 06141 TaxID=1828648 RepID=UPI001882E6D9|nr:class I SAM-dependent methyltransferase [Oculatella sp. LEGE 06141]MBE9182102.1 methyltransferase domain-containing protein [Oculatella sp. LEGE 06141]
MPEDEAFYDNPDVRARYLAHRAQPDNPNTTLERPLFLSLAGDLSNLDIVDLGCGDAAFGQEALRQGARSYTGIEASQAMVDVARQVLANTPGKVDHNRIETWQAQSEQADLVSSRLALNYVEHLQPVFQEMYQALRPGGRVVVSVEHPVITSNFASLAEGRRTTWLVDNYFQSGARVHLWLGQEITKYHHTLEEYFDLVIGAGFELERVRESRPQRDNFVSAAEYERRLRIPLFLAMAARKPNRHRSRA